MDERFVPAKPMAILQYLAPLITFTGQQPSVSWKPWDLIPGFAKPRCPFSDCTGFRVAKPVQIVRGKECLLEETGRVRWTHKG